MDERFQHSTYLVRRKVLKLFGGAFHIWDGGGNLVFFSKMKAFKLREDIRLYTGEDLRTELLLIQARQIIDFAAAYDVVDPVTGDKVGALKRKGLKSIVRDQWVLMDAADREIGVIGEDTVGLALLRRLIGLIPQKYHAEIGTQLVATFKQNFNPFVYRITLDFSPDTQGLLDRRLGLAAGVLLAAVEGKQG